MQKTKNKNKIASQLEVKLDFIKSIKSFFSV